MSNCLVTYVWSETDRIVQDKRRCIGELIDKRAKHYVDVCVREFLVVCLASFGNCDIGLNAEHVTTMLEVVFKGPGYLHLTTC